jgi:tetratricopeptide (TPR) repeat protein
MAESKSWILETYKSIKGRFHSWEGLVGTLAISLVIFYWAQKAIGTSLKEAVLHFWSEIPAVYFSISSLVMQGIIILGVSVLWLYKRKIPRFSPQKAGILFSSSNPEELKSQALDLQERVRSELKDKDLLGLIEVRILPPHIIVSDVPAALEIVQKAKATLLVWGFFERSAVAGRTVTGFPKINFTYSHPSNISLQYHQQVGLSLIGKKWTFEQQNEFLEKSLVVNNIAQVALNIVGMSLLVKGHFEQAEAIFVVLDAELEQFRTAPSMPPELAKFSANVRRNHVEAIAFQMHKEYQQIFRSLGIFHATKEEVGRWRMKLNEAIRLDKRDSRLFVMLTILCFLAGDIDEALKSCKKAHECAPSADPSPDFCFAFLHLYTGDFRRARNSYKIALAKKGSYNTSLVAEILEFIQQAIAQYPDKFQLHFALALLNEERLDRSTAKQEYILFIERAKSDPYYSKFVGEAIRRLDRLG